MVDVVTPSRRTKSDARLRTLVLISAAHWVSHFHMLVLPMLFPFLKTALNIDYIDLGFALTVFAVVSALTQAPVGYLVDHFGARRILLLGLCLGGASLALIGIHLSYPILITSAILLGLANSVYHPADYAILDAHMDGARMGRAFSIHTFAGYLGGAMAPMIVAALMTSLGGVTALVVCGVVGPLVAVLLLVFGVPEAGANRRKAGSGHTLQQSIITPVLIMLTIFFMLLGLSTSGISSFGVVALMNGFSASFSTANVALTAYLAASAIGVLAGGFLADRTDRHSHVAVFCFAINAAVLLLIALVALPSTLLTTTMAIAGFLGGMIAPSRDMLVRKAAPEGGAGRAFGIVSTGFNFSGILSPLLFGWLMDQGLPRWVFIISALFMALTVVLTLFTERKREPDDARVGAA
ncbi:MFS transporter [Microvirga yunnanensis]|uniref:MFS transporter n=1 Tax=Microvirga yunnanensis TaxID=2953740 RepID=UPI0021CA97D0|nr:MULTISPECIES: MFS transporter [unclassified Microvirga]